MTRLSDLLHELIDHAVPMGNRRGELHDAVNGAVSEILHVDQNQVEPAEPVESETAAPAAAKPVFQTPKTAKPDGAAGA